MYLPDKRSSAGAVDEDAALYSLLERLVGTRKLSTADPRILRSTEESGNTTQHTDSAQTHTQIKERKEMQDNKVNQKFINEKE